MMGSNWEPIPKSSQKHDPAWKHCQMLRNGDRVQLKCVYCSKVFKGGGIHRIKEHLAGQKGNAATCLRVPPDVRLQMQQSLDGVVVKKRKKQKIAEEITNLNPVSTEIDSFGHDQIDVHSGMELIGVPNAIEPSSSLLVETEEGKRIKGGERRKRGRGRSSVATANANAIIAMNDNAALVAKKANAHVHMAIGRFLYDIGAPLDAVNSPFFKPMVDAIASEGEVIAPSYHDIRGWILKKSVEEVKNDVNKQMATWATTGCSVLVDQWHTTMDRTMLRFLVDCSEGVVFLKSVDASVIVNSPDSLYELIKQVVEEIGVRHILQVITNVEDQYIVAGRRLSDTFPTLYWAPCVAHCLDLILDDFAKLEWINATIEQARSIARFVYNNSVVLNMVRRHTFGNDIVVPGVTRSVTNFATLKQMVDLKHPLQTMVTSQEWMDCLCSKKPEGLEMLDLISGQSFWSSCVQIVHLTNPLLRVLRIVSSKKRPSMGYVYAAMYRVKEAIKKELIKQEDYVVYWNIIEHWWEQKWNLADQNKKQQSNLNLHAAGFYLNPKFFYSIEGDMPSGILSRMYDCIEKLIPDIKVQDKIIKEISLYKNATGDFGRKMAVRARDTMLPAEWWSTYGGSCPNLARLAIRVLSQTCSSMGYTRNQTPFEQMHDTTNFLERNRLNDLVFVQYNLRLRDIVSKEEEKHPMDSLSFEGITTLEEWVKGKDLCSEDSANPDWMAVHPPSSSIGFSASSVDEFQDLGAGFDDYEIFDRVKEGDGENVEDNMGS